MTWRFETGAGYRVKTTEGLTGKRHQPARGGAYGAMMGEGGGGGDL